MSTDLEGQAPRAMIGCRCRARLVEVGCMMAAVRRIVVVRRILRDPCLPGLGVWSVMILMKLVLVLVLHIKT